MLTFRDLFISSIILTLCLSTFDFVLGGYVGLFVGYTVSSPISIIQLYSMGKETIEHLERNV